MGAPQTMVIRRTWWAVMKIRLYNQGASVHALKARGKLSVQHLVTRRTSMFSLTPQPLQFQGKSTRQPLKRWLRGPQNLSGSFGEQKNLLFMPGSASSQQKSSRVTAPTTLHSIQEILTAESYTRFRVQKRSLRLPPSSAIDRSEVQ